MFEAFQPNSFQDTGFQAGEAFTLSAGAGTFTVAGQDALFRNGRTLTSAAGTVAVSGVSARVAADRKTYPAADAYVLSGQSSTFRRTYAAMADAGVYDFVGYAAGVPRGLNIRIFSEPYTTQGVDARLAAARVAQMSPVTYEVTGKNARLARLYTLYPDAQEFAFQGYSASVRYDRKFVAQGEYLVSGQSLILRHAHVARIGAGAFNVSGQNARVAREFFVRATPGGYVVTGIPARLFESSFFYTDSETLYPEQELRSMSVTSESNFGVTFRKTMPLAVENRIMYVPPKIFSAEDPSNTDLRAEPRQRARA